MLPFRNHNEGYFRDTGLMCWYESIVVLLFVAAIATVYLSEAWLIVRAFKKKQRGNPGSKFFSLPACVVHVLALIGIVAIGAWRGWSDSTIHTIVEWGAAILISVILSGFCGTIIERVSGDFLKRISLPLSVGHYNFSISLFVIVTPILKFILFRGV